MQETAPKLRQMMAIDVLSVLTLKEQTEPPCRSRARSGRRALWPRDPASSFADRRGLTQTGAKQCEKEGHMSHARRVVMMAASVVAALFAASLDSFAQGGLPNPYRPVQGLADGGGPFVPGGGWARLPGGRAMGPPASVYIDIDGESLWAVIRCDETSPVPLASGGRFGDRLPHRRQQDQGHRHGVQVQPAGRGREKLRPRHVHLAARTPCRPRRQRVGDRCRDHAGRRDGGQGRREGRTPSRQVQPGWPGADDARRTGRCRQRRAAPPFAELGRHRRQRRHLHRRRPRG